MILEIAGVTFGYGSQPTVEGIGFEADAGDVVSILGPNGVGKTTLLKCINNIHSPAGGSVLVDSRPVLKMRRNEIAKTIGYVPQRAHISGSTVFESILIGRKPHIGLDVSQRDLRMVGRIIDIMGLSAISQKPVNEISGGEYQMVQIARALAQQPRVMLLDEPTSNLDLRNQYEVLDTIRRIVKDNDMCAVMTNHDLNQALRFSDRFILMKGGRIHAAGGKEIIDSKSIKEVYGIDVIVGDIDGKTVVVPEDLG